MNRRRAALMAEIAALRADQAQIHVWAQEERELLAVEMERLRAQLALIESKLNQLDQMG